MMNLVWLKLILLCLLGFQMLCGRLIKDNKEEVLDKAEKDLEAVRGQHFPG